MDVLVELSIAGLAVGGTYSLVALGFVIVFKGTRVLNFAQGVFVTVGAYSVWRLGPLGLGLNFYLAVLVAVAVTATLAVLIERLAIRPLYGKPLFTLAIVTLGVEIVVRAVLVHYIGDILQPLGDPLAAQAVTVGGARVQVADIRTIAVTIVLLAVVFALFRFTRIGIAMRATAEDQEAAFAAGLDVSRIFMLVWALAGLLAVAAGVAAASRPPYMSAEMPNLAFRAFPAIILGGLDSLPGAVVGGLVVGMVEILAAFYAPDVAWLGRNFHAVAPYLLMLLVLLIRPYGLFGTPEVERV